MPSRFSPSTALAVVVLALFTVWITWRTKLLEQDLDANSTKISLTGKAAPDFHLTSLDGRSVSLADYRGKRLVVVFCASWNIGSPTAVLSLSMFYKQVHTAGSDFEIAAVSVDEDKAAAQEFAKKSNLPFPVVLDPGMSVAKAFQVRRIPTVMLIDAAGKVTYGTVRVDQAVGFALARELGIKDYRGIQFGAPNAGRN